MKTVLAVCLISAACFAAEPVHDQGTERVTTAAAGPTPEELSEKLCTYSLGASPTDEDLQDFRQGKLAARSQLCNCLKGQNLSGACRAGGQVDRWIRQFSDLRNEPLASTNCGRAFLDELMGYTLDHWKDQCELGRLNPSSLQPSRDRPESCWALTTIRPDGCVVASYQGPGTGNFADLPANLSGQGNEAVLCHPGLSSIHRLKDPLEQNQAFQSPQKNLIFHGRLNQHVTYGPANCHGTAAAIIGPVLPEVEVEGITYHSQVVEAQCSAQAKQTFDRARRGRQKVTIADLGEMQISINMLHGGCQSDQCGTTKLSVFSCDGGKLIASAFIEGMCEDCWVNHIKRRGYVELGAQSSWQDFAPGCVLTDNDHSITLLMQSCGWCYYYESTSPFGPPQLRMDLCPALHSKFARKLCPSTPAGQLSFQ